MNEPGPQPSGLFLFDKPKGITSHDAVYLLRRKLGLQRIGHTGTLDPMATGLLILLAGSATKAQEAMQGSSKVYSGIITFGAETDTWDAEGKIVSEAPIPSLDAGSVSRAVAALNGKIVQQVPPYSAVRMQGKPMYKHARRGAAMPEVRREVEVKWLSWEAAAGALRFELECSGGTYVRSLARELGLLLGSRAHLSALRRVSIGSYSVSGAVTEEALAAMTREQAVARLLPPPGGRGA
ncbi:MAG: tRNA pseudouridine(55) synthase TruB [Elusimicrobiales bacterium]|nr:tRNA pseudouridine(55) synthase TruB [Elusimicrobiales bacterium]